jgi:hypothetical protein
MRRDIRMRMSGESCAYWGQWRKMEGRLRAMKPEKQSQRASRDEEEGKEEENKDKIEREIRFSQRFIIRANFFTLLPHNLSA